MEDETETIWEEIREKEPNSPDPAAGWVRIEPEPEAEQFEETLNMTGPGAWRGNAPLPRGDVGGLGRGEKRPRGSLKGWSKGL